MPSVCKRFRVVKLDKLGVEIKKKKMWDTDETHIRKKKKMRGLKNHLNVINIKLRVV